MATALDARVDELDVEVRDGHGSVMVLAGRHSIKAGAGGEQHPGAHPVPSRSLGAAHPAVVTAERRPGEEETYGSGMALVTEWRRIRGRRGEGTALERARISERVMELEVEMLGKTRTDAAAGDRAASPDEEDRTARMALARAAPPAHRPREARGDRVAEEQAQPRPLEALTQRARCRRSASEPQRPHTSRRARAHRHGQWGGPRRPAVGARGCIFRLETGQGLSRIDRH